MNFISYQKLTKSHTILYNTKGKCSINLFSINNSLHPVKFPLLYYFIQITFCILFFIKINKKLIFNNLLVQSEQTKLAAETGTNLILIIIYSLKLAPTLILHPLQHFILHLYICTQILNTS